MRHGGKHRSRPGRATSRRRPCHTGRRCHRRNGLGHSAIRRAGGRDDGHRTRARSDRGETGRRHREHARLGGGRTNGRRCLRARRQPQRRPLPPMSRLTVAQAEAWNPDALRDTADEWDAAATDLRTRVDGVVRAIQGSRDYWNGSAAEAARGHGATIAADGALATRCLITAAVAARDGAAQMASARSALITLLSQRTPLLVPLTGGSTHVAAEALDGQVEAALDRLAAADADTAADVTEALNRKHGPKAQTVPAGAGPVPMADVVAGWSAIGQDRI